MSQYSETALKSKIDTIFYDEPDGHITGVSGNEIFNDILDSLAMKENPLPNYPGYFSNEDLDSNLEIIIIHGLGTLFPWIFIYDHNLVYLNREWYKLTVIDSNTIKLTFYQGIPYQRYWRYCVYKKNFS